MSQGMAMGQHGMAAGGGMHQLLGGMAAGVMPTSMVGMGGMPMSSAPIMGGSSAQMPAAQLGALKAMALQAGGPGAAGMLGQLGQGGVGGMASPGGQMGQLHGHAMGSMGQPGGGRAMGMAGGYGGAALQPVRPLGGAVGPAQGMYGQGQQL
jgi:RNA-binding protein Musashi